MTISVAVSDRVFPTLVGVFLTFGLTTKAESGLPHARGGVSKILVVHLIH